MKLSKHMNNLEIADLLRAVAASLELKDKFKNKFRIIAYERAADSVEHSSSELKDLWDEGKLKDVPGIGEAISKHLGELFETGISKHFISIMKGLPPATFKLMKLPGIGPKTAYKLVSTLGVKKISDLEIAAKQGKIAGMEGFGPKSQEDILRTIKENKGKVRRHLLPYAMQIAEELAVWLKKESSVVRVDPLGSLRRKASTVGDIDISVASNRPEKVIDHFEAYPKAIRSIERGDRTASLLLPGNIQIDLMVQPQEAYGALLQHFTGSKHHNIALREYALKRNLSLSEYGIKEKGKLHKMATEDAFYRKLGMDYIEPELREDTGEIEAAVNHKLPSLVELKDVKADLQIHSNFDIETSHDLGESSFGELVDKANDLGYEYLAMTEHNPSYSQHKEKDILDILKRKKEAIDKINYSLVKSVKHGVKYVFNCLEIDILPDGNLPISDKAIELLDFALISVHSSFKLSRAEMTKRIIKALSHPKVKIFAHPTARKLNEREGIEINWPEIFNFCLKNSKWIEINADPMRLDLPDFLVKEAVKVGVKLSLGTDAHHKDSLENMQFGIAVARRGWAQKKDIVNCLTLAEFKKVLE